MTGPSQVPSGGGGGGYPSPRQGDTPRWSSPGQDWGTLWPSQDGVPPGQDWGTLCLGQDAPHRRGYATGGTLLAVSRRRTVLFQDILQVCLHFSLSVFENFSTERHPDCLCILLIVIKVI